MSRFTPRLGLLLICLFSSIEVCSAFAAESEKAAVERALNSLNQWLGRTEKARGWNIYLKTPELRRQLARRQADPAALAEILDRYQSAAAEADQRFVAVRSALENWRRSLTHSSQADLAEMARAEKANFRAVSDEELAAAERNFIRAKSRFERFLGNGRNGKAWKKYLGWEAISAPQSDVADIDALEAVADRLASNQPGTERREFRNFSRALDAYLRRLRVAQDADAQKNYEETLEELAASLETYTEGRSTDDANLIGELIQWLQDRGQAGDVTTAIAQRFRRPNVLVEISESLFAVGLEEPVSDVAPVRDVILGTNISGTGYTSGSIQVELVPNRNRAAFDSLFYGRTQSQTLGRNGRATIRSRGTTRFGVRKRTYLDEDGFSTLPATAAARTRTTTQGVSAGRKMPIFRRIADNIARDRVAESKAQSEAISARHTEDKLRRRVDREAAEEFAKANRSYEEKFRRPLLENNIYPSQLHYSSTNDYIVIRGLEANSGRLGAPRIAPKLPGAADLSLRVHETAVDNGAFSALAGRTILETELAEELTEIFGEMPDALKRDEDEPETAITFAEEEPITVRVDDLGLSITLRGTRFKSDREHDVPMNIHADYKLHREGSNVVGVRQGELVVLPPDFVEGEDRLAARQTVVRRLLTRRFNDVLKERIVWEPPTLPGDWKKAGKLRLTTMTADDGWLMLQYDRPGLRRNRTHAATARR